MGVDYPCVAVLFFELDVHSQMLRRDGVVGPLFSLGVAFVDLDVLDCVGADIVEHDLIVTFEKLFAVEQERFYKFAVDGDLAVFVDLGSGQLCDKGVEHGSFGELKGRGVIDYGVAFVVEFDF